MSSLLKVFFKPVWWIGFILFVSFGFFRDAVFLNVNDQLYKLYYGNYDFRMPLWLRFLENLDYMSLYRLKFFLTGLFLLMYFFLTRVFMRIIFKNDKMQARITILVYGALLLIAALVYIVGYLVGDPYEWYAVARTIIGWMSSPVILMVLVPAFLFRNQQNEQ